MIEAINEQLGSETMQFCGTAIAMSWWMKGKPRAVCVDPQSVRGRLIEDALPTGMGDILRELMETSMSFARCPSIKSSWLGRIRPIVSGYGERAGDSMA